MAAFTIFGSSSVQIESVSFDHDLSFHIRSRRKSFKVEIAAGVLSKMSGYKRIRLLFFLLNLFGSSYRSARVKLVAIVSTLVLFLSGVSWN